MPKRKDGWMLGGLPHDSARYKHLHVYVSNRPEYRQTKRHVRKRFGKLGIEIDRIVGLAVSVSPTAPIRRTLHPALDGMVVHHLYALKCRCSSYPPGQIDLYAGLLAFRESETKHSAMRQSGRFRLNLIIGKKTE